MSRISNIIYPIPPKVILCNIVNKCVGEVLLKQWKQGNTCFIRTIKRPLKRGLFFVYKYEHRYSEKDWEIDREGKEV